MRDLSQPPSGANLIASTVDSLVQPYPLAVAGTPTTLTYTPATRVITFRWSTSRPGGGAYGRGVQTSFVAPAVVYPGGYRVSVTGGVVTSAPNAPVLTIKTDGGARSVRVRVAARRG